MAKETIREKNPLVGIAAVVCVMIVAVTLFLGIFAREEMWVLAIVAPCMVILGVFLGYWAKKN